MVGANQITKILHDDMGNTPIVSSIGETSPQIITPSDTNLTPLQRALKG